MSEEKSLSIAEMLAAAKSGASTPAPEPEKGKTVEITKEQIEESEAPIIDVKPEPEPEPEEEVSTLEGTEVATVSQGGAGAVVAGSDSFDLDDFLEEGSLVDSWLKMKEGVGFYTKDLGLDNAKKTLKASLNLENVKVKKQLTINLKEAKYYSTYDGVTEASTGADWNELVAGSTKIYGDKVSIFKTFDVGFTLKEDLGANKKGEVLGMSMSKTNVKAVKKAIADMKKQNMVEANFSLSVKTGDYENRQWALIVLKQTK